MEETPQEVSLIPPGKDGPEIDDLVGKGESGEEGNEIAFSLEYQLRDFIASNLSRIDVNGKRLRLYVDPAGPEGIEFRTEVGFVDILAVDDDGAFYVFELKRAESPDRAIGQLTRYMGWLTHTIAKEKAVYGVIVARSINQRLRYAVSVIPNVSLFEYEVEFHLRPAHKL